jgi:hypothetical protein
MSVNGRPVGKEKALENAKNIASFLNVPFEERRPPTVQEILGTIKDAVTNAKK